MPIHFRRSIAVHWRHCLGGTAGSFVGGLVMRRTRNSQTAGTRRRRSSSQPAPSPLLWRPRTPTANVTDLVDIVAHDLSNALTAATLSVSTMYRKGQVTEGTARPVRVLDEALRQMVRLVSDLRDVGQ